MSEKVVRKTYREVLISEYIGLVFDMNTRKLRMVVNPTDDRELDDKAYVTAPEDRRVMVKVARDEIPHGENITQHNVYWIEQNQDKFLPKDDIE